MNKPKNIHYQCGSFAVRTVEAVNLDDSPTHMFVIGGNYFSRLEAIKIATAIIGAEHEQTAKDKD